VLDWTGARRSTRRWKALNHEPGIQGNLDRSPLRLSEYIKRRVTDIPGEGGNRNGHIFNLGHGILPTAPTDNVKYMIDLVHELSARK